MRVAQRHSLIKVGDVAPTRYLSLAEFADIVGVSPDTLKNYALPPADGLIGRYRGWLPDTVATWQQSRPGRGARTDLRARGVNAAEPRRAD